MRIRISNNNDYYFVVVINSCAQVIKLSKVLEGTEQIRTRTHVYFIPLSLLLIMKWLQLYCVLLTETLYWTFGTEREISILLPQALIVK